MIFVLLVRLHLLAASSTPAVLALLARAKDRARALQRPGGSGAPVRSRRLHPDAGSYTTEMVIAMALIAAATLAIVGIIVGKVTDRANSINL